MVGGETDSSLREETGVCPTMPLVRWQTDNRVRVRGTDLPKDAANLHWAINSRTDAASGSVAYVAVSGRRFVARVFVCFRERRDSFIMAELTPRVLPDGPLAAR